jgi:hypothetical protein
LSDSKLPSFARDFRRAFRWLAESRYELSKQAFELRDANRVP